jgi:hypothetical protein
MSLYYLNQQTPGYELTSKPHIRKIDSREDNARAIRQRFGAVSYCLVQVKILTTYHKCLQSPAARTIPFQKGLCHHSPKIEKLPMELD